MSVIVRRAGRRDLGCIQALWQLLRDLEAKSGSGLALSKDGAQVAGEHREVILADPRSAFFVAEEQGEVLGFLHAQVEPNDPVYEPPRLGRIVDLIVVEERRREGIGTRLVECCREWLLSQGLTEYRVTLPVQASAARLFFERLGTRPLTATHRAPL